MISIRLTAYNAFSVRLDGRHIGYLEYSDDTDEVAFHDAVVAQWATHRGADRIRVSERVTLYPTRAPASERMTASDLRTVLGPELTYQVVVIDIYVNGRYEVTMRNSRDADQLEHLLKSRWFNENTIREETAFLENWERRYRYVDYEDVDVFTSAEAEVQLRRPVQTTITYIVRQGDNLTSIARAHETTHQRIAHDNNIDVTSHLNPGQRLLVETSRPLLNVRTVEQRTEIITIPMPVDYQETTDLAVAATRIITPGRNGEKLATIRTVRINGEIYETYILDGYEMQRPPETRVVAVGVAG